MNRERLHACCAHGAGRGARRGLTLVEVMLAVTILGVSLMFLLTAVSRCLAVMKLSRNYQTAQWTLALGELEHPLLPTNTIEDLEVLAVEYPNGFTFSREVADDDDEDGLHVVRSRASWALRGRQVYEEITRYVYRPPEDEPL